MRSCTLVAFVTGSLLSLTAGVAGAADKVRASGGDIESTALIHSSVQIDQS
jgi:hypothetical protein